MMSSRLLVSLGLVFCAFSTSKGQMMSSTDEGTRSRSSVCSAFADSLLAVVPRERLPIAEPSGWLNIVRSPTDAKIGRMMRSSVLVRPDGSADTTTVVITGTEDAAYRRAFVQIVAAVPFIPSKIDGCAVWGAYWITLDRTGEFRTRP